MSEDIKDVVAEFEEISKTFRETIQEKLKVAFSKFFAEYPEFRSIEWNQYTPYFNDGEPCEFRVCDFWYSMQKEFYTEDDWSAIEDFDDYSAGELEDYQVLRAPTDYERKTSWYADFVAAYDELSEEEKQNRLRLSNAWEQMSSAMATIPDEVFLATFENHSSIRVTKDGITITEYDHD